MSNAPLVAAATGSQQARVSANNPRGVSALLYACQQGDVDKVRRILRAQANAHLERDRTGKSALHYCCTSDRISAAQAADVLVMAAPDLVESRDEDGFTPLHLAVIAGNMPLVTFLLANNADVNAVDNEKHTVVHWATVCGETVALRAVLAAGAPVSTPDVHGGYPLHYAAQMCGGEKDSSLGLQVLHTLLSHQDISVSVEDGDGRPPLLWAASAGSAKAVLALIRAGSAVESHDKDGLTALHCAASRGHTDCIDTLLTLCGASPDVIDTNGCTALHYAVTLGHADATALLLAHSADPNRQDRKGRCPAHCGCAKGQFETVKMLGAHGANLWLRNARGDLPLHEAAASGRRDLVKWLLEARPSQVNARNNDGRCPLHLAALNDNADMCKILLDAGAQINPVLRTSKNIFMTPLDCALQRGFRSTAKYLQLHGGIPANRLACASQGPTVGSAVSLQIRDDVTLWGDTSSETEKEEVGKQKSKKKSYKRKLSYKYEKKKAPISVSEYESGKISTDKLESAETLKAKGVGKSQGSNIDQKEGITHHADFPFLSGNNIPPGEIFIYANEVNINEKFGGVRIQQNGEVILSDSSKIPVSVDQNRLTPQQASKSVKSSASSLSEKQDKRPKSAKYGRLKNKSGGPSEKSDSAKRKSHADTPDPRRKQTDEEESSPYETNEKMQHAETTKETAKTKKEEAKIASEVKDQKAPKEKSNPPQKQTTSKQTVTSKSSEKPRIIHPDQQSARSNTSYEDAEDHKELVVEAAVHSPPREITEENSPKQHLEINELPQERRRTPIGSEIISEDNLEKIESAREKIETPEKESKIQTEHILQTAEIAVTAIPPTIAVSTDALETAPSPTKTITSPTSTALPVTEAVSSTADAAPSTTQLSPAPEEATRHTEEALPADKKGTPSTAQDALLPETAASLIGTATLIAETATAIAQVKEGEDKKKMPDVSEKDKISEDFTQKTEIQTSTAQDIDGSAIHDIPTSTTTPVAATEATVPLDVVTTATSKEPTKEQTLDKTSGAEISEQVLQKQVAEPGDTQQVPKQTTENQTTSTTPTESKQSLTTEQEMGKIQQKLDIPIPAQTDGQVPQSITEKTNQIHATTTKAIQESTKPQDMSNEIAKASDSKLAEGDVPAVDTHAKAKSKKEKRAKRVEESETSSEALSPTRKHKIETGEPELKTMDGGKRQKQRSSYKKRRKAQESPDKATDISRKPHHAPEARKEKQVATSYISPKRIRSPQESSIDAKSSEESEEETSPSSSSPSSTIDVAAKEHRSFKVLDDNECTGAEPDIQKEKHRQSLRKRSSVKKPRAQSEESKGVKIAQQVNYKEHERLRRSKIPTPVNLKTPLSKSDKHLDRSHRKSYSGVEPRVPSLPNIHDSKDMHLKHSRSISNLSAPLASTYSDNDHETGSDGEEVSSATRKKRLRKRSKTRGAKSAGSDYESSNLIDSGFEPSPRSSRIPKWKNVTERGVNMTSVTQTIQSNIRRYHLERKIFQHLLDLKRLQIRSGQHNEAMLVKRAIDTYHRSCAATVGAGRYVSQDYSFKAFEYFLYNSLRKIQRNGSEHLQGLPEPPRNPLLCTQSTHRCDHATHAYTGVPCAAYLPKMDHHTIPKIGFECKPSGFLPKITPKNAVTLELCHGNDKQVISLPAERLDQNKRYYVTFTVKGGDNVSSTPNDENNAKVSSASHTHSKSD